MRQRSSIVRYNIIVFEQDFVYANRDVNSNIEDALNARFAYVDKNIEGDVASRCIRDVFNIEVERNINNVCEIAFNSKDCFVEIVSMHAIANINILEEDNFVDNKVEDVSMSIIVKKKYIEIIFVA